MQRPLAIQLSAIFLFVLLIGAIGLFAGQFDELGWLVENEERLRGFVQKSPWIGWFLGFALYFLFSLIPGTVGKSVVCGWIFGFWPAVLMVDLALTGAALISFSAARHLMRQYVESRFAAIIGILNRHLEQDGVSYLLMLRFAHIPFSFMNYSLAITSVSYSTFCLTTAVGLLPSTMVFVFIGTRIPSIKTIAEKGVWELMDPILFVGLAATTVFPLLLRWAQHRLRRSGLKSDKSVEVHPAEAESNRDLP